MPNQNNHEMAEAAVADWRRNLPRSICSQLERVMSSEAWFEVYRLRPDVFALYEPGQFEEVISYLVLGKERAALIDTGMGIGNIKQLVRALTRLPITVVNTHSHYDHVGHNHLFNNIALFDAPNSRQASKNGYDKSVMKPMIAEEYLSRSLPEDFDPENYHVPPFEVTRWLKDEDVIDLGNRNLHVFHMPGHSPDSIFLLDREARLLWTGDMYYPGPIYLHLPGSDLDAFIRSFERITAASAEYDTLLPSHNEPMANRQELEKVLRAAKEIKSGTARYAETIEAGVKLRRYEHERFAILTRAQ